MGAKLVVDLRGRSYFDTVVDLWWLCRWEPLPQRGSQDIIVVDLWCYVVRGAFEFFTRKNGNPKSLPGVFHGAMALFDWLTMSIWSCLVRGDSISKNSGAAFGLVSDYFLGAVGYFQRRILKRGMLFVLGQFRSVWVDIWSNEPSSPVAQARRGSSRAGRQDGPEIYCNRTSWAIAQAALSC